MLSVKRYWYLMSFLIGFFIAITFFGASNGRAIDESALLKRIVNLTRPVLIDDDNKLIVNRLLQLSTGVNAQNLNTVLGKGLPVAPTDKWHNRVAAPLRNKPIELPELRKEKLDYQIAKETRIENKTESKTEKQVKTKNKSSTSAASLTMNKKKVFVYQTHNRESWLSVTSPAPQTNSVEHPTQNITLTGRHLAKVLTEKGIGTIVNTDDFYQNLLDQGKSYVDSYEESLKAIQVAKRKNKNLEFFFDLHRDDKPREKTTVTIKDQIYARVYFVVGSSSKHTEKNRAFAEDLHTIMESKYPGLSRGIIDKDEGGGNGEYNQSVSPNSILLEIGGIENSVEEGYNSVAAFADVLEEYLSRAQ